MCKGWNERGACLCECLWVWVRVWVCGFVLVGVGGEEARGRSDGHADHEEMEHHVEL